jgi:hypothetical protein
MELISLGFGFSIFISILALVAGRCMTISCSCLSKKKYISNSL